MATQAATRPTSPAVAPVAFDASSARWQAAIAKAKSERTQAYGYRSRQMVIGSDHNYWIDVTEAGYVCTDDLDIPCPANAHGIPCYHVAAVHLKLTEVRCVNCRTEPVASIGIWCEGCRNLARGAAHACQTCGCTLAADAAISFCMACLPSGTDLLNGYAPHELVPARFRR